MIRIFTDTSANLPAALAQQYGLTVIPFPYSVDGVEAEQSAGREFDGAAFYAAMRAGAVVKTAMINIASFIAPMRQALEQGEDVLYIGMSGGISGAAHAASIAVRELRDEFPGRQIAAIDTLAASLGEGLLVLEAARLQQAGASFGEIAGCIAARRETMCQYFTVEDLEYLKRGGRVSKTATVVGTLLKIKPLLTGDSEGRIVLCGKVRERRRSLLALADDYEKLAANKSSEVGIAHADDEAGAAFLLDELKKRGLTGPCLTVCYEPVTGAHVGPGAMALFFQGIHK